MLLSLLKDVYAGRPSNPDGSKGSAEGPPACERWRDGLLLRLYPLMHTIEQDNFDAARYGDQAAKMFYPDRHAAYPAFLLSSHRHQTHRAVFCCASAAAGRTVAQFLDHYSIHHEESVVYAVV